MIQRPSRSFGLLFFLGLWTGFYSMVPRTSTFSNRPLVSRIRYPQNDHKTCLFLLGSNPSLSDAEKQRRDSRVEREIVDLKQITEKQKTRLSTLRKQLEDNRQARQSLQAEMVALRFGYGNRLAELEDALEFEQNKVTKLEVELEESKNLKQSKVTQLEREAVERQMEQLKQESLQSKQNALDYQLAKDKVSNLTAKVANLTNQLIQRNQLLEEYRDRLQETESSRFDSRMDREKEVSTKNQLLYEYQSKLRITEAALADTSRLSKEMVVNLTSQLEQSNQLLEETRSELQSVEAELQESQLALVVLNRRADELATNFSVQLSRSNQLLDESQSRLETAEEALEQRQSELANLQGERRSLRKLIATALNLIGKRATRLILLKSFRKHDGG